MKPRTIGSGAGGLLVQASRYVLREDRLEELATASASWEVTRLFFDEATCATVHRKRERLTIAVSIAVTVIFLLLAFGFSWNSSARDPLWIVSVSIWLPLAAVTAGLAASVALRPRRVLVVRARDQTMEVLLPRGARKREKAIRDLVETIETYQRAHAPAPDAAGT